MLCNLCASTSKNVVLECLERNLTESTKSTEPRGIHTPLVPEMEKQSSHNTTEDQAKSLKSQPSVLITKGHRQGIFTEGSRVLECAFLVNPLEPEFIDLQVMLQSSSPSQALL